MKQRKTQETHPGSHLSVNSKVICPVAQSLLNREYTGHRLSLSILLAIAPDL